ncbi:MAG TPA: phosphoribosylanthranilate isomerase [Candidatus Caccocola faecipullorum]|nr:phosphoribosylanthranilate isomerase [Candidatus Caccocola faecipullorum]
MTKIKICGLSRECDIDFVNEAKPDYAGFVVNFPKSRRNVSLERAKELALRLSSEIMPVGVFVDERPEVIAELVNCGAIRAAQLHGSEDEEYIKNLRALCRCEIIQAFRVKDENDVRRAAQSSAECVLLDGGQGEGRRFDWKFAENFPRPCFIAGGLGADNAAEVIDKLRPFALDMSSGVETDGFKDLEKIKAAVAAVRRFS